MCGIDFSRESCSNFTGCPNIWYVPEGEPGIEHTIYNAKILRPLCNIRNNYMADEKSSPLIKRVVSYLCAAALFVSAIVLATAEAITRLALGIITAPIVIFTKGGNNKVAQFSFDCLLGYFVNLASIGYAIRTAAYCFTKQGNI